MSIGSKLKTRRIELDLDVADVARRVGMSATTLYDLERGEQRSTTKLAALCRLYGLNSEWVEYDRGARLAAGEQSKTNRIAEGTARYTLHGMQITSEEVEFGIEWGKLDEPARTLIRQQVMLLVAEQVRRKRAKRDAKPDDKPRRDP